MLTVERHARFINRYIIMYCIISCEKYAFRFQIIPRVIKVGSG